MKVKEELGRRGGLLSCRWQLDPGGLKEVVRGGQGEGDQSHATFSQASRGGGTLALLPLPGPPPLNLALLSGPGSSRSADCSL